MARNDDPNASQTVAFGIVGAILVFVIIVALQAVFYRMDSEEHQRKVVAAAPEELERLRAEQIERLNSYRWVDAQSQTAAIPIERAMDLVVRELQAAPAARPEEGAGTR